MPCHTSVERPDASQTRRPERIAVVGVFKCDETRAVRVSLHLPKLNSHLHGRFHSGGAVIAQENLFQCAFGKKARQSRSQLDRLGIGCAKKRDMGHTLELILDGPVDSGVGVAVDIRPNRGIAIQVASAFAVLKPCLFAFNKDKW